MAEEQSAQAGKGAATEAQRAAAALALRPDQDESGNGLTDDQARDALHIMPLKIVPIQTKGVRRARLVKTVQMETMVELFQDSAAGSGQVKIDDLGDFFPGDQDTLDEDQRILLNLARCYSFDVYSLRVELRRLGISVNDYEELQLSEERRRELTYYMRDFTRPLIQQVYGSDAGGEIQDVSDIINMLQSPNRKEALENLKKLSGSLGIELHEIPSFLEEYGDIYLSLAYFRACLDEVVPVIHKFLPWMREVMSNHQYKDDLHMQRTCKWIDQTLDDITTSLTGRFEMFDRRSKDLWTDITAERFQHVRELIANHHTTIGGVLCGLALKMRQWVTSFPNGGGGPHRRVEFIKSEIRPGLAKLKAIEDEGKKMAE